MGFWGLIWVCVFGISFVLTMVGLGGGLVFSPLFVLLGFAPQAAASASLFLNLVAAASAVVAYSGKNMVDYTLALPLILSSALAAPVGSYVNGLVQLETFMLVMAVILVLAAIRMATAPKEPDNKKQVAYAHKVAGGLAVGLVIGFLGGLLGIGGGVFVVPLLIYVLHVPVRTAAASSTFIVCFSSLTGFIGYASMYEINWAFILPAAVFSFLGGQAGARFMAARLRGRSISIIFSLVLVLLSLRLVQQAWA